MAGMTIHEAFITTPAFARITQAIDAMATTTSPSFVPNDGAATMAAAATRMTAATIATRARVTEPRLRVCNQIEQREALSLLHGGVDMTHAGARDP